MPLQLVEERVFHLPPLSTSGRDSAAVELLAWLAPDEAVEDLVGLAERADGVPLLLQLIASALRWRSAVELNQRLGSELWDLADDRAGRPERHKSAASVLRWGMNGASSRARDAVRALTVIQKSFSITTAEAVLAATHLPSEVRQVMAEIVDLGLIYRVSHPGEPMFRMLEPVRESVFDVIGGTLGHETYAAHAQHYFRMVDKLDQDPDTLDGANGYVRTESHNILAALEWAWTHDRQAAMEVLGTLLVSWAPLPGYEDLVDRWAGRALAEATARPSARARVAIAHHERVVEVSDDQDTGAKLLQLADACENDLSARWHDRLVARHAWHAVQRLDARSCREWIARFRPSAGAASEARRLHVSTWPLVITGNWVEWLEIAEVLLELPVVRSSVTTYTRRLGDVGYALTCVGRYSEADEMLEQALGLAMRHGLEQNWIRTNLVFLEHRRGRPERCVARASEFVVQCPSLIRREHDLVRVAALSGLALVELGRQRPAARLASFALPLFESGEGGYDVEERELFHRLAGLGLPSQASVTADAVEVASIIRREGL